MEGIGGIEEHVSDATHLVKGKRTKRRLRSLSPYTVVTTTVISSCSSATGDNIGGGSFSSTTFEGIDQEEETDMANCLILLAQGRVGREQENNKRRLQNHQQQSENHVDGYGYNKITEKATKNGYDIYECKTCNRSFHSFQALGGHRASHKKPKMKEEKNSCEIDEANKHNHTKKNSINISPMVPPVSLELRCGVNINFNGHGNDKKPNRPNKIHECSICGAEFTSGQALGGHMRRHRASINNNTNHHNNNKVGVHVKSRNVLELDLNLPAPENDIQDSTFQFPVVTASPALVGCHY
ncbi:zinc finger protein ZAT5-like [Cicer arietinum]|uniref:Zinc finger protein ZAT5-like n=1 Tax=Cicer arietinum TaxID=3827 RepID=A0A1S2XG87_CICAR|nr:zinc finger protein ZAT5-like [Cicer arietinum]